MKTEIDRCENRFCLYWENNRCKLAYVTMNNSGCCENYVYVELPEEQLKRLREKQLDKLESL